MSQQFIRTAVLKMDREPQIIHVLAETLSREDVGRLNEACKPDWRIATIRTALAPGARHENATHREWDFV